MQAAVAGGGGGGGSGSAGELASWLALRSSSQYAHGSHLAAPGRPHDKLRELHWTPALGEAPGLSAPL